MKLKDLIAKDLAWCVKHRDQERAFRLHGGLVLVTKLDPDGAVHLLAARLPPSVPSEGEVQTVLRHWPNQPVPVLPWELTDQQRQDAVFDVPDVHRGIRSITLDGKTQKYNALSFQWRPVTPQPFATGAR